MSILSGEEGRPVTAFVSICSRLEFPPAAEQAAHHAVEQAAGAAAATALIMTAPSAAPAGTAHRLAVGHVGGGDAGGDDLGLQRLCAAAC